MKLYDSIIEDTMDEVSTQTPKVYKYDPANVWEDTGTSEFIMMRDAAYELGGSGLPSVSYTCVTTTEGIISEDEICVYGPDLSGIRKDISFARIAILEVEDIGEDEEAYNAIRNMEYVRYHVFPKGYMPRVSSESNQEAVRVSKDAVSNGISFEKVGNDYIRKYHELPGIKNVRVIFIADSVSVKNLRQNAAKVDEITKTLTHILDGLELDCASCQNKAICDEVEGIRELHLGKLKK